MLFQVTSHVSVRGNGMSRMGSSGEWGDDREIGGSRSGRGGGPQDSGMRRNEQHSAAARA